MRQANGVVEGHTLNGGEVSRLDFPVNKSSRFARGGLGISATTTDAAPCFLIHTFGDSRAMSRKTSSSAAVYLSIPQFEGKRDFQSSSGLLWSVAESPFSATVKKLTSTVKSNLIDGRPTCERDSFEKFKQHSAIPFIRNCFEIHILTSILDCYTANKIVLPWSIGSF